MEQNPESFASQPAAEGPASLPAPARDDSYWRGYHAALAAMADAPPDDPASSPRVRRVRVDGFTGAKQVVFLEGIAEGLTVGEAAARAGISTTAVYNFRNRRAGRAFNIGWEAADRRARRPLADHLRDRSAKGQTDTYRDGEGAIVGTRHRHDNRLAMAILTRLDRKAEAYKEDERLVTVVAEEFEELLDAIEAGAEDAEEFIDYRRPTVEDYRPRERAPRPVDNVLFSWEERHRYDKVDPAEIDISDLDPAGQDRWTDDQWARAWRSGLLARLEAEERGDD
jgi:AcrR family transcriptional regulator